MTFGIDLESRLQNPMHLDRISGPEVSIVMPCLNEADTVGTCIGKAQQALSENNISGEIIVADNGSTDGSPTIARSMGARVIEVKTRGYGNALMGGIEAARGEFIIMGDADDSYNFLEIPRFIEKLRDGFELVQGCRLPSGGGTVKEGAMPFLHRWLGNPVFSLMAQRMFFAAIHDINCGLRAFTKRLYNRLHLTCTGMEFAVEMVIKASIYNAKISEVPITLHQDGRKSHAPHLKTFRDGWRTLRFFLLYSPRWLFFYPGLSLIILGLVGYSFAMPSVTVKGVTFDVHTLLFSSLFILLGYQSVVFAIFARTFAATQGFMPESRRVMNLLKVVNLERGLFIGTIVIFLGLALLLGSLHQWRIVNFGNLDYVKTMRLVIPGVTLTALGFQTVLSSFFLSILGISRR